MELGSAIGYPIRSVDENAAWLDPNERVHILVVDTPAWEVCRELPCSFVPQDDHIGAVHGCQPVKWGMRLQIDGVTGDSLEATTVLARQLRDSTPGEWDEIDKPLGWSDARIRVPKPGVIIVTAPFEQLLAARDTWRRLIASGK